MMAFASSKVYLGCGGVQEHSRHRRGWLLRLTLQIVISVLQILTAIGSAEN